MDIESRVREALQKLDLIDLEIRFLNNRGTRVLVSVISPGFVEMDEGERQELVWGKLLDELGDYDSRRVEFVFTDTPKEIDQAKAEVNAAETEANA